MSDETFESICETLDSYRAALSRLYADFPDARPQGGGSWMPTQFDSRVPANAQAQEVNASSDDLYDYGRPKVFKRDARIWSKFFWDARHHHLRMDQTR